MEFLFLLNSNTTLVKVKYSDNKFNAIERQKFKYNTC